MSTSDHPRLDQAAVVDETAAQAAARAADDFMSLFGRTFLDERTAVVSTTALRDALPATVEAVAVIALPAQCTDITTVVLGTLDQYDQRSGSNGFRADPTSARYTARGYGALQVRAAFDRALATFPERDELPAAEAAVADVEQRYRTALADLEAAVNSADLARVGELRGDVEIALPAQLHDARMRLLELRFAQAKAEALAPRQRAQERYAAIEEARQQVVLAADHLQRKQAEHAVAHNVSDIARQAATASTTRIAELQKEHEQMLAQYEHDRQRRVRQLAGLPATGWVA